ncbi:MAG: GTP-binding protein [Chloroflexi bacterium]|nr:MAG: GTP-binding protein [Chloroflexota bacterium]
MPQSSRIPIVAIVGRPNVGKSTLFNRLVGARQAIVSDEPGTTRDRIIARVDWGDRVFTIVDTGGLFPEKETGLWPDMRAQIDVALDEADVIVFLTDALDGITSTDMDVASLVRRRGKPVVLGVNKVDNQKRELLAMEFYELGIGEPVFLSAYHNSGVDDLMIATAEHFPPPFSEIEAPEAMQLAIVGRPNVGKSMLLNTILGDKRAVVSDIPGTTRDATDTLADYQGDPVLFIDTAGIRRRGKVEGGIEKYSVIRSVRAIERADVAFLVVEALEPGAAQDQHVSGLLLDNYTGVVLVVNKWDLAAEANLDQAVVLEHLRERFKFASHIPVRFTSALEGSGIEDLMAAAKEVYTERNRWVEQQDLSRVIRDALMAHPPPTVGKRYLRISQPRQEGVAPPMFTFAVNYPEMIHFSYRRYLENELRAAFGFRGNRLKLIFRVRDEDGRRPTPRV